MGFNMANANKIVGVLAIGSLVGLFACTLLGFFVTPHYQAGVDVGMKAFVEGFVFSIGAKAGLSVPKGDE